MKKLFYILSFVFFVFAVSGCRSKEGKADREHARAMAGREEFIEIFRSTGRPGTEAVISHLDSLGFFTMGAGGHHTREGGMVRHSLEVYRLMKSFAWFQPSGSIAVVALFHDMGKARDGGWHTWYSVQFLQDWGFELTDEEYLAIYRHHNLEKEYLRHPLHRALVVADALSTGWWKLWHPGKRRKD